MTFSLFSWVNSVFRDSSSSPLQAQAEGAARVEDCFAQNAY